MRIVIENGTVITATETMQADVLVEGEKVAALVAPGAHDWEEGADRVIDATGKWVVPGGIDIHTHMELPFGGTVSSDDFETGTRADHSVRLGRPDRVGDRNGKEQATEAEADSGRHGARSG